MAQEPVKQFTAKFGKNLDEIDRFLAEAEAPQAYDGLLDELRKAGIPRRERFPGMGQPLRMPTTDPEALRECVLKDYLLRRLTQIAQEARQTHPGKKLSSAGTITPFYKAVADAHLAHIIKVNLSSEVFTYEIDERAQKRARLMDGKRILVANVPDSPPPEIVARFKALVDIERVFHILKSEIGIAPVGVRGRQPVVGLP